MSMSEKAVTVYRYSADNEGSFRTLLCTGSAIDLLMTGVGTEHEWVG